MELKLIKLTHDRIQTHIYHSSHRHLPFFKIRIFSKIKNPYHHTTSGCHVTRFEKTG
jgi:hypothetical protein